MVKIMDDIKNILKNRKPKQKNSSFRFQEICAELIKLSGLRKGIIFALWKKHGNRIEQLLAEVKQGEIKDVKKYLLWNLKKEKP